MRFSEEEVYVIGVVGGLLLSAMLTMPLVRYMVKWYWSHPRPESYKEHIPGIVVGFFTLLLLGWVMVYKYFYYPWAIWAFTIGSVLESLVLYPLITRINGRLMARYAHSFTKEEKGNAYRIYRYTGWYCIGFILMMNLMLVSGGIGLVSWAMPDVVEVRNVHHKASYAYDVDRYYVLPYHHGLQPGGCYIDNLTIDTVYRLVVTYGYSGEDRTNHYAVKEQYPPHSFSRMRGRTVHAMDTIAPWMPASHGRMGRYRTQRVYLTDYMHLQDFISVDMRRFGLYGNERVDRIMEGNRNSVIRESPEKYRAYKSINPYPYIRLIPDSLRKTRLKGRAKKKD